MNLRERIEKVLDEIRSGMNLLREEYVSEPEAITRQNAKVAKSMELIADRLQAELDIDQPPYIEKTTVVRSYNPEYGDTRRCKCGHAYYRHFDSYDNNSNVGCKYCCCFEFVEDVDEN